MLNKSYDPKEAEARLYNYWETEGYFKCGLTNNQPFSIVIPPPNVTGSLHMGHALNNTLQDIIVRYKRMLGEDVLWQTGTDHAGIATQMVVERKLEAENKPSRIELGREKFIDEVWKWKEESGNIITHQLRRLGASCDWSRERFTMDEGLSLAVNKVFVDLYNDGLIYKDKRLVNWDPQLRTAISDLEVIQKEVDGYLWYINYPIKDSKETITIATTRPETMFGDTAIAVHPGDNRYADLIGKEVIIPIIGRSIKIIIDEYADPEQGSGAVKITPAHDFNDFEVGKRNNLEMLSILDIDGKLNENVDKEWQGLDRFEARSKLLKMLSKEGYLEKEEKYNNSVPHGDRSDVVIEPFLTEQWYVDAKKLAKPALDSVKSGDMEFIPSNWSKTYFEWLENIQPWCISRQLWWGHRIPAWYTKDGNIIVAHNEKEAFVIAEKEFGKDIEIYQDEDVLDTWFSSALWPFSTLGWPEKTAEIEKYYPTNLLVTGFDIIFFWVARMMMMGIHFMGKRPFSEVYIHALVRDEKGQKMSKSKGNIVDPLDLIDKYGADSLRFTLTAMAAQGRDVKLSESRVQGYRNFGTKIWNASRFCEMNDINNSNNFDNNSLEYPLNIWILNEFVRMQSQLEKNLAEYRFNDAANIIYQFIWGTFCDWYIELIKPHLSEKDDKYTDEIKETCSFILDSILISLHPFMPFITEEIWQNLKKRDNPLIIEKWRDISLTDDSNNLSEEINDLIEIISNIRSIRVELNIKPKEELIIEVTNNSEALKINNLEFYLSKIANISNINEVSDFSDKSANFTVNGSRFSLLIPASIDLTTELSRVVKEEEKLEKEINSISNRLKNKDFIDKAPKEVVEENKIKIEDMMKNKERLLSSKELIKRLIK
ncbi:MAG: valine--tRNA ligase [Rhodobiaceae bacterium]|nr:valine--tRNA ligase [Rhodobiaceae bacterium]